MLGAKTGCTSSELEQKVNNLEQSVEWLVKEFSNLKDQLEKQNNISEEFKQKLDTVENVVMTVDNLTNFDQKLFNQLNKIEQKVSNSDMEIDMIQNQLEYDFQTVPHNSK